MDRSVTTTNYEGIEQRHRLRILVVMIFREPVDHLEHERREQRFRELNIRCSISKEQRGYTYRIGITGELQHGWKELFVEFGIRRLNEGKHCSSPPLIKKECDVRQRRFDSRHSCRSCTASLTGAVHTR